MADFIFYYRKIIQNTIAIPSVLFVLQFMLLFKACSVEINFKEYIELGFRKIYIVLIKKK